MGNIPPVQNYTSAEAFTPDISVEAEAICPVTSNAGNLTALNTLLAGKNEQTSALSDEPEISKAGALLSAIALIFSKWFMTDGFQAIYYEQIGDYFYGTGQLAEAQESYEAARIYYQRAGQPENTVTARQKGKLAFARILFQKGETEKALGWTFSALGETSPSAQFTIEVTALHKEIALKRAAELKVEASISAKQNRLPDAISYLRERIYLLETFCNEWTNEIFGSRMLLGRHLLQMEETVEAARVFKLVDLKHCAFGETSIYKSTMVSAADLLSNRGEYDEAISILETTIDSLKRASGLLGTQSFAVHVAEILRRSADIVEPAERVDRLERAARHYKQGGDLVTAGRLFAQASFEVSIGGGDPQTVIRSADLRTEAERIQTTLKESGELAEETLVRGTIARFTRAANDHRGTDTQRQRGLGRVFNEEIESLLHITELSRDEPAVRSTKLKLVLTQIEKDHSLPSGALANATEFSSVRDHLKHLIGEEQTARLEKVWPRVTETLGRPVDPKGSNEGK